MIDKPIFQFVLKSLVLLPCLLVVFVGCGSSSSEHSIQPEPANAPEKSDPLAPYDRGSNLRLANESLEEGDTKKAERLLREILAIDPTDTEALMRYASVLASKGDNHGAIEILDSIPPSDPKFGVIALGQAADLCLADDRGDEAITRYGRLIERIPSSSLAHRQMAFVLNRQGRRHEAARHIRVLCKLGDVREDELHALMVLTSAIYDDPNLPASPESVGRRFYPIGASGVARKLFTDLKFQEAADVLAESFDDASPQDAAPPAVAALYGRCLIEAQDDDGFKAWLGQVDEPVRGFSEYWAAVGAWLLNQQRFDEAIRALAEAVIRDPTDARSYRRMHQALLALNRPEDAKIWEDRHLLLRKVTLASNKIGQPGKPDLDLYKQVREGLEQLNRPLEATLWHAMELLHRTPESNELEMLNEQRRSLVESTEAFPDRSERVAGLDYQTFPMPDLNSGMESDSMDLKSKPSIATVPMPRFENVAGSVGLDHSYQIASQPVPTGFMIFQSVGGGVAVLDYDLDGHCDLYFAQGGADPPQMLGEQSNLLFRQVDSVVQDVTDRAGAVEQRYSTGVTAGDWNQDGFPDIAVSNLGTNLLLINNGDGSFRSEAADSSGDSNDPSRMSTSIAIADLTGDGLPDIYEQNYLHDPDFDVKPQVDANGVMQIVAPSDYQPAIDQILVNDGRGNRVVRNISESTDDRSTGLGLVIADFDGAPGNEVFIGNDVRPNQLWKRPELKNDVPHDAVFSNNSAVSSADWLDIASMTGTAVGHDGLKTASMGIAAGDFDRSGTLDLHITNFENAPARLYLSRDHGFQDRAAAFKIAKPSYSVLGFGCQALDYNNDGFNDLVVTNGHVENTNSPDSPFEQPPQLFVNFGDHFELTEVEDRSGYFGSRHVGRALARLDFNSDGKPDFVVTHIQTNSALMINRTESNDHWIDLNLVGVECERDAIGTKIVLKSGDQTWTNWVIAGDGYLCRNEQVVSFGLGDTNHLDSISITWPDHKTQTFEDVSTDQRLLLVQNDDVFFTETFGNTTP